MSAPLELVSALPVAVVVVLAALRWGAHAVLTLLAGVVALLARDSGRGERALEVLRLLRRPPRRGLGGRRPRRRP